MTIHVVLPDSQAKPGKPTFHLEWIGQYLVDQFANKPDVKIIHLGDHWDMPSLSSYDKGKRAMEGRRYVEDIEAGNAAFDALCKPLDDYNARKRFLKERQWHPERHFLLGNHEYRIVRACDNDAQLDGLLSLDHLNAADHGWTVHPFLEPVDLDGVKYAHYWANPMTGRPYGGAALTRLKTLGHSFTMGHQQTLDIAVRFVDGVKQRGLIAGASYPWNEDYLGPQGNHHWRGILVCHEVANGSYDLMEVSLDFLARKYAGVGLAEYMAAA